jgi:membrane protease subunit HflK
MLLVLAAGIPLYMCASASTPVAAALLAKGVSPGAALVFLLAGPATNAATVLLLHRAFGRRFVAIYLGSVAAGALAAGIAFDALVGSAVAAPAEPGTVPGAADYGPGDWAAAAVLLALIGWRFARGAFRRGLAELAAAFARPAAAEEGRQAAPLRPRRRRRARLGLAALGVAVLVWLGRGFHAVPPDSRGYGFVFGALARPDLRPGLHWLPPAPLGAWETRQVGYPRKADVGFRTDLDLLARRRELTRLADRDQWHSAIAAMNADPERTAYLTADENLVEMSFTVHYGLDDPAAFFYRLDHRHDLVGLYAEAVAREEVAGRRLEPLLAAERGALAEAIRAGLARRLAALGAGIAVAAVHVVDLHPPGGAVFAFRDVAGAREDRETRVHQAWADRARDLPRARGEAAAAVVDAAGAAQARIAVAGGEAESFRARAGAFGRDRALLSHLLATEAAERALAGRDKVIVPPGAAGRGVTLWRPVPPRSRPLEPVP